MYNDAYFPRCQNKLTVSMFGLRQKAAKVTIEIILCQISSQDTFDHFRGDNHLSIEQ